MRNNFSLWSIAFLCREHASCWNIINNTGKWSGMYRNWFLYSLILLRRSHHFLSATMSTANATTYFPTLCRNIENRDNQRIYPIFGVYTESIGLYLDSRASEHAADRTHTAYILLRVYHVFAYVYTHVTTCVHACVNVPRNTLHWPEGLVSLILGHPMTNWSVTLRLWEPSRWLVFSTPECEIHPIEGHIHM